MSSPALAKVDLTSALQREKISFKLSKDDLTLMGQAVSKLHIATIPSPNEPGAFTIRNHAFSTDAPGAFTIRNYSFNAKDPSAFTIRNYSFGSD
ncbi:hypothetical protein PQR46_32320 [Paraburkholderia sediminicola]|uniref:hypothetical protein n=1 Tax=Paraburkholderia sediminicola TaxID=458836 RepID=UPI0038BE0296